MITVEASKKVAQQAFEVRKSILQLALKHKIHIGGDLSVAEIMAAIWQYMMKYRPDDAKWEERDRFVLSKGHGAAVTTLNQAAIGCYTYDEVFEEYATDFGRFGMHSCNLLNPHVEVSTGSLGHGLPVAVGIAAGLRLKGNKTSRVYTVVGDGESEEGSIWEAVMLAQKQELGNLVCFIDSNKLQCSGPVADVSPLDTIADKFAAFGWKVLEVDGHDVNELMSAFDEFPAADSVQPIAVICDTVKGKGISFMENAASWHNGMVDEEQYKQALNELETEFATVWGGK